MYEIMKNESFQNHAKIVARRNAILLNKMPIRDFLAYKLLSFAISGKQPMLRSLRFPCRCCIVKIPR